MKNIEKLKEQIVHFDHTYEMSDDYSVYRNCSEAQRQIVEETKNLHLSEKRELLKYCKMVYNSWGNNRNFDNDEYQIIQNKMRTLCGFSFNTYKNFSSLPEEYKEEFIEQVFDKLVDNGDIYLSDNPMEDHPSFDRVCDLAEEKFDDKYYDNPYIDDGRYM